MLFVLFFLILRYRSNMMSPKLGYLNFLKSNEEIIRSDNTFIVVAFYKFFDLSNILNLQTSLYSILSVTEIKGTILIVNE